jgi:tetratricopeptide (TPR) repeat protein
MPLLSTHRFSHEKAYRWGIHALFFSALGIMLIFPLMNFDIFWHMANGRAMVEEGRIVSEELFSYTAQGTPFHNREWLSQVIFYLVYNTGGESALILFKTALLLLASILLYRTARFSGVTTYVAMALVLFAYIGAMHRFTVRPQAFSFLFLMLSQFIVYGARSGRLNPRSLYWLVLVLPVWDILHGALWGVMFLGAFSAGEALLWFYVKYRKQHNTLPAGYFKHLILAALATITILAASPYGLREYGIFFEIGKKSNYLFLVTEEFMPTKLAEHPVFWAFLTVSTIAALTCIRHIPLPYLFVLGPFAAMALKFNRATAAFIIIAVPVTAWAAQKIEALIPDRSRFIKASTRYTKALLLIALAYTAVSMKFFSPMDDFRFGLGLNKARIPEPAVSFIKDIKPKGNMYNEGHYGGYLAYELYPQKRIFMYNIPATFGPIAVKAQSRAIINEYNIQWTVLSYGNFKNKLLFDPDQWVPVFWHGFTAVSVRNIPSNNDIIERYGLKFLLPGTSPLRIPQWAISDPATSRTILNEAGRLLKYGENRELADFTGTLALRTGLDPEEAQNICGDALVHNLQSAPLYVCLGANMWATRDPEAEAVLLKALKLDSESGAAYMALGRLYFENSRHSLAADKFDEAFKLGYNVSGAIYGRALSMCRLGNITQCRAGLETFIQKAPQDPRSGQAREILKSLSR